MPAGSGRWAAGASPPPSRLDEDSTQLLLGLVQALHASALPTDVVEERLGRVAAGLGMDAQFFSTQSFVAAELRRGGVGQVAIRRFPFDTHWNLARTIALDQLAAALAEGKLDAAAGRAELDRILHRKSLYPRWLVTLAWGVVGAAMAAKVGGRWSEMVVGALIGFIAAGIHFAGATYRQISLEKALLVTFLGTLTAFGLAFVVPPFDYPRALYAGIVLIVPSTVVTYGVHELANDELEAGTARLIYGIVGFGLMGAGVVAAFSIGKLVGVEAPHATATPLPELVVLGFVAVGGVALAACMEGRPADIPWIVLSSLIAVGTQELTTLVIGKPGAPMLAAFILGSAAWAYARLTNRYPITMILPGLRMITPGFLGTQATFQMLTAGHSSSSASFFDVILLAIQLGIGITAAGLVFQRRKRPLRPAAWTATPRS